MSEWMSDSRRYSLKYEIGDYVKSDDYPQCLFVVYGKYHEYMHTVDTEYYENYYDCYCVLTRKAYVIDEINLTLFKRTNSIDYDEVRRIVGDYADKRNVDPLAYFYTDGYEFIGDDKSVEASAKSERVRSVDELLDDLSDINALIALVGEHEDDEKGDGKYAKKKDEILRKLKEWRDD